MLHTCPSGALGLPFGPGALPAHGLTPGGDGTPPLRRMRCRRAKRRHAAALQDSVSGCIEIASAPRASQWLRQIASTGLRQRRNDNGEGLPKARRARRRAAQAAPMSAEGARKALCRRSTAACRYTVVLVAKGLWHGCHPVDFIAKRI